ncbi:hypothetical protein [Enterococcus alishanensis]
MKLSSIERTSLKWRIIDELYQNFSQRLWIPETTEQDLVNELKKLDVITDVELIEKYGNILEVNTYADREGILLYLNEFKEEISTYFIKKYGEDDEIVEAIRESGVSFGQFE